jgi:hypothetical protein
MPSTYLLDPTINTTLKIICSGVPWQAREALGPFLERLEKEPDLVGAMAVMKRPRQDGIPSSIDHPVPTLLAGRIVEQEAHLPEGAFVRFATRVFDHCGPSPLLDWQNLHALGWVRHVGLARAHLDSLKDLGCPIDVPGWNPGFWQLGSRLQDDPAYQASIGAFLATCTPEEWLGKGVPVPVWARTLYTTVMPAAFYAFFQPEETLAIWLSAGLAPDQMIASLPSSAPLPLLLGLSFPTPDEKIELDPVSSTRSRSVTLLQTLLSLLLPDPASPEPGHLLRPHEQGRLVGHIRCLLSAGADPCFAPSSCLPTPLEMLQSRLNAAAWKFEPELVDAWMGLRTMVDRKSLEALPDGPLSTRTPRL